MTPKTEDEFPEIERLLPWATPFQTELAQALIRCGSVAVAADTVGMSPARFRAHLSELRTRASRRGYSPAHDMTKTVPEGFFVRGVSTYYSRNKKTGELEMRGQWVKSAKETDHQLALLLDAIQDIAEPFRAKSPHVPPPKTTREDLLCVYPMGDPHLGMYAWAAETGQDFDLEIAESNLVDAVDHLVDLAPPSREALAINLGDFFHADSDEKRTKRSGNVLDVDTRWAKVLSVGVRTERRLIDRMLEKHELVHVINAIGNHDDYSSIMLSLCLQQFYANNPRVRVDTSPAPFHWFRFGANLIGVTHGHNVKPQDLPGIMARDRRKDWGETDHQYWYTGHVHHDQSKEYFGVMVETFRTLAPNDAWAHSMGYRNGRDMKLDVIHREFGRINRHTVGIQQIWRRSKERT